MTHAARALTHFRLVAALGFNFNIIFLPLYVVFDLLFIFTQKKVFKTLRTIIIIFFFTGLAVIYLLRIGTHLGWFGSCVIN